MHLFSSLDGSTTLSRTQFPVSRCFSGWIGSAGAGWLNTDGVDSGLQGRRIMFTGKLILFQNGKEYEIVLGGDDTVMELIEIAKLCSKNDTVGLAERAEEVRVLEKSR